MAQQAVAKPADFHVDDYVLMSKREGYIRFIGERDGHSGIWYGIELTVGEGRNDGSEHGTRYFECEEDRGIFVRFKSIKFKLGNPKCAENVHSDSNTMDAANVDEKVKSPKSPNTPKTPKSPYSPSSSSGGTVSRKYRRPRSQSNNFTPSSRRYRSDRNDRSDRNGSGRRRSSRRGSRASDLNLSRRRSKSRKRKPKKRKSISTLSQKRRSIARRHKDSNLQPSTYLRHKRRISQELLDSELHNVVHRGLRGQSPDDEPVAQLMDRRSTPLSASSSSSKVRRRQSMIRKSKSMKTERDRDFEDPSFSLHALIEDQGPLPVADHYHDHRGSGINNKETKSPSVSSSVSSPKTPRSRTMSGSNFSSKSIKSNSSKPPPPPSRSFMAPKPTPPAIPPRRGRTASPTLGAVHSPFNAPHPIPLHPDPRNRPLPIPQGQSPLRTRSMSRPRSVSRDQFALRSRDLHSKSLKSSTPTPSNSYYTQNEVVPPQRSSSTHSARRHARNQRDELNLIECDESEDGDDTTSSMWRCRECLRRHQMEFRFCPFCGGVRHLNSSNITKEVVTVPLKQSTLQSDDILDIQFIQKKGNRVKMNALNLNSKSKSHGDVEMESCSRSQTAHAPKSRLIGYKQREHKVIESDEVLMAPSEDEMDEVGDSHTVESSALSADRESIRYERGSRGGSYDYDHDLEGSEDHSHFSSSSTVKQKEKEKESVNGDDAKMKRRSSRKWKPRKPKPAKNVRRNRSQTRERKMTKGWD